MKFRAAKAAAAIAGAAFAAIRFDGILRPQANACGYMLPRHPPRITSVHGPVRFHPTAEPVEMDVEFEIAITSPIVFDAIVRK